MSVNACMDENSEKLKQLAQAAEAATARSANTQAQQQGTTPATARFSVGIPKTPGSAGSPKDGKPRKPRKKPSSKTEEEEDEDSAQRAKVIWENSTPFEKIQYRELFNFFDVDKDRTWGALEFCRRMTEIGCPVTPEQASDLLTTAGVRDLDRITFDDFVQLMPKLKAFRQVLEKDALRLFRLQDTRGRGWISKEAMREVLLNISSHDGMGPEQIEKMCDMADRERTGCITYDFFIRALFGTPPVLAYKPPKRKHHSTFHQFCFCARPQVIGDDSSSSEEELEWDTTGQPGHAA